ncbi:hypothetical protein J4422_04600 [Candidatus Pacearchaeota archaeon]|nr:hypothetical protein [Candidatus Pacearchaeota archaeon]
MVSFILVIVGGLLVGTGLSGQRGWKIFVGVIGVFLVGIGAGFTIPGIP